MTKHTPNAQSAQETWKIIPGFDGRYEVSDHGRVRAWFYRKGGKRQEIPKYLCTWLNNVGYFSCKLHLNEKSSSHFVHRLVMLAFVGPSELTVNHKDGNKTNNHLSNLEYMTHRDNIRHSFARLGRKAPRGEHAGMARLSDTQVAWLRQLADEGKSNTDLAQIFDISPNHVSVVKTRKVRK